MAKVIRYNNLPLKHTRHAPKFIDIILAILNLRLSDLYARKPRLH